MKEYGIETSRAEFWVHFHPFELMAYWYKVWRMRLFVRDKPLVGGRSADGSLTGRGHLVPKAEPWIWKCDVSANEVGGIDWEQLTDREMKRAYEPIVAGLLMHGAIRLQGVEPRPIRIDMAKTKDEQYAGIDCWFVLHWSRIPIELKGERVVSRYLFVQRAEQGHKVHLTPDGEYRYTDMEG
jgi:hypothetical protein